jgi:DNA-binding NtrC family response regulator
MPRLLIVDDDPDVREVLAAAVEDAGVCHVETASSAAEALTLLERGVIEAAIIDATMPGVSGLELARQTMALGIPTLIISGDPKYLEDVPELGCPFLAKPFRSARLRAEVEALLDEARRRAGGGMTTGAPAGE